MFFNEVSFEARGVTIDGVEIIVKEIASATSEISYEDAWLKAHAVAKEKAEAILAEKLKLLTGEVKEKLCCLKGDRGFPGPRGPKGDTGPTGPTGPDASQYFSYSATNLFDPDELPNFITNPTSSKDVSTTCTTLTREDITPFVLALSALQNDVVQYGVNSIIGMTNLAGINSLLTDTETRDAFKNFLLFVIEYTPLECLIYNKWVFINVEMSSNTITFGISSTFKTALLAQN